MTREFMVVSVVGIKNENGHATPLIQRFNERFNSLEAGNAFIRTIAPMQYVSRYQCYSNMAQLRGEVAYDVAGYWSFNGESFKKYFTMPYGTLNVFDTGELHTCIQNPSQDVKEFFINVARGSDVIFHHAASKSFVKYRMSNVYDRTYSEFISEVKRLNVGLDGFEAIQVTLYAGSTSPAIPADMTIQLGDMPKMNPADIPAGLNIGSVTSSDVIGTLASWSNRGCAVSSALVNTSYGYSANLGHCTNAVASEIRIEDEKLSYRDMRRSDDAAIRVTTKPRRVVEMILLPAFRSHLKDTDFERFTNQLKARKNMMHGTFSIVSGGDIAYWYGSNQYASDELTGTLGHSCMRDMSMDTFDIYAENSDVISMLIYVNGNGELLGRALLWRISDDVTLMDRVYASDANQAAFFEYAANAGYLRKTFQNYVSQRKITDTSGNDIRATYTVKINGNCDQFPYMDTMIYSDIDRQTFSNAAITPGFKYQNIYGSYSRVTSSGSEVDSDNDSDYRCNDCGDELEYAGDYCELCREQHNSCGNCGDDSGENAYCNYCQETVCSNCGEYESSHRFNSELNLCSECFHESYFTCESCGNDVHNDDAVSINGMDYCDECSQNHACSHCQNSVLTDEDREASDDAGLDTAVCADCLPDAIVRQYRTNQICAGQKYLPGMIPTPQLTSDQYGRFNFYARRISNGYGWSVYTAHMRNAYR